MKRYETQISLPEIGLQGQQKLTEAKVLIIGIGGLGCPVLQNLAAAGVGTIGIVDGDIVKEANLHRQFLYSIDDCGIEKVTIATKVVLKQNPLITIVPFATYLSKSNALDIVSDYQIIVDCTDSISIRYLINDICLMKKIPMVYASIYKFEGQLSVFNYQNGPTYRCLFPENESLKKYLDCNESGVLGILPSALGILQATEVLKIILGIGSVLKSKLLLYSGLSYSFQTIDFKKNEEQIKIGFQNGVALLNFKNTNHSKSIQASEFFDEIQKKDSIIIDIRESYEEPKLKVSNIKLVPLIQLEDFLLDIDKSQKIILCCQHGTKSNMLVAYLTKKGYNNLFHLQNGVKTLEKSYFSQSKTI